MMIVFDSTEVAAIEKIYFEVCDELGLDPNAATTVSKHDVIAQIVLDATSLSDAVGATEVLAQARRARRSLFS